MIYNILALVLTLKTAAKVQKNKCKASPFILEAKYFRQRLEFPPAFLEVLVLVVARSGGRQQHDIAFLGMGGDVGEGFLHRGIMR